MRPWKDCVLGGCPTATTCGDVGEPVCYNFGFDNVAIAPLSPISGIDDCTGGELVSQILQNCYSHDGSTMYSIDTHCGQGWKGVAATKIWQGIPGFVDSGSPCCNDGGILEVKYKTQSVSEVGRVFRRLNQTERTNAVCASIASEFVQIEYSHDINQASSLDDYGNVSRTGGITMLSKTTQTSGADTYLSSCLYADVTGSTAGFSEFGWAFPNLSPFVPASDFPLSAECGIINVGYASGHPNHGNFPSVQGTSEELNALEYFAAPTTLTGVDVTGKTHTLTVHSSTPATFTLTDDELKVTWGFSATDNAPRIPCATDYTSSTTSEQINIQYTKTVRRSASTSYAETIASANTLLDEWDLTNDLVYPWRQDGACWLLPLVTFDEGAGTPSIDWGQLDCPASARSVVMDVPADCSGCRFQDSIQYTGEIRGSPLPAGYGPHFNYHHIVWDVCCSAFGDPGVCEEGLGELGASPLPIAATQWTDKSMGWRMRGPGGHISQYDGFTQTPQESVVVQKWAETLEAWPRENLARPAARDRYLFDETDVACGSVAGTDLTLSVAPAVDFSVGEKVAVNDEVYSITGGSGLAYTVSALLYNTPVICDGVARLRYPSARAIMSTIAAAAVQTSPGLVTVTTTTKHRLKGGGTEADTVTFTGISGLTSAVATVVDEYNFTVSGTLTTSPSTGVISDGGSANDSTCSTHSFLYRTFQSNYRGAFEDGEDQEIVTETMVTIAPSSRHPTVICISPNGETFPHGVTYGFGTIGADMCHGEDWSANILQAVPSPYWQTPHVPCGHAGGWTQVALPCQTPTSNEYAFPPLVEPMLSAPWTAVDGLYFGGYSYPGAVGRANCLPAPYENSHSPQWYPAWLTCTDWQELIGHRCG
jgi:hypothetical protein